MSRSSCVLRNLDNPLLNGIALGLELGPEQSLQPSADMFPCCQGKGFAWHSKAAAVENCGLPRRIKQVEKIYQSFRKAWPQASWQPHQVPQSWGQQTLTELAGVFRHDRPQATVSFTSQKQQASILWYKALAATWRFGIEARVWKASGYDAQELVRFTEASQQPIALFVEHAGKLWDPQQAEAIEFIVQQAYNAQFFLWIEFIQESSTDVTQDNSLRGSLSRRIQKLKSNHPLQHLSQDCISRLQCMSASQLRPSDGDSPNA